MVIVGQVCPSTVMEPIWNSELLREAHTAVFCQFVRLHQSRSNSAVFWSASLMTRASSCRKERSSTKPLTRTSGHSCLRNQTHAATVMAIQIWGRAHPWRMLRPVPKSGPVVSPRLKYRRSER